MIRESTSPIPFTHNQPLISAVWPPHKAPEFWPFSLVVFVLFLAWAFLRLKKWTEKSPSHQLEVAKKTIAAQARHIKRMEQEAIANEMEIDQLRSKLNRLTSNIVTRSKAHP